VRLDIVVAQFWVPSVATRVVVGIQPCIAASATVVDARTGDVIIADPGMSAAICAGSGLYTVVACSQIDSKSTETLSGRLIARYGAAYREWLTHEG